MNQTINVKRESDDAVNRVVAFALQVSLLTAFVTSIHPYADDSRATLPRILAFTFAFGQAAWMTVPGMMLCRLSSRRRPKMGVFFGVVWCAAIPLLVSFDVLAHAWTGRSFLSTTTLQVLLRWSSLRQYITWNSAGSAILVTAACVALLAAFHLIGTRWLIRRLAGSRVDGRRVPIVFVVAASAAMMLPFALCWDQTVNSFDEQASRNPLRAFPIWKPRRTARPAIQSPPTTEPTALDEGTRRRDPNQFRLLASVDTRAERSPLPDIVLVIVESMRPELVDPQTMPELHRQAKRGIWCKNHFSGGNATTHGMFSLLNGLEASWYESPVRFTPLLNHVFRKAGYEVGFFAGHDGWSEFYMDAFIHPDHFDAFSVTPHNGLSSDRLATVRATQFLDEARQDRPPRIAILYLYATHAIYSSYPKDQVFQPAADDRLLYPYAPSARERVWNRYRNSARTVDRFLSTIMNKDRLWIVTGDHGEAFLEDRTIGHGTRISRVQNSTAAVVFVPGRPAREIETATMHADLLPTLVEAVGWNLNEPQWLDGVSLLREPSTFGDRCFATRDYLSDTYGLIGPWTLQSDQPFALKFRYSYRQRAVEVLEAIDASGEAMATSDGWNDQVTKWRRP